MLITSESLGLMRVCSQGNSPLHFVAIPFLPLSADCGGGGVDWCTKWGEEWGEFE